LAGNRCWPAIDKFHLRFPPQRAHKMNAAQVQTQSLRKLSTTRPNSRSLVIPSSHAPAAHPRANSEHSINRLIRNKMQRSPRYRLVGIVNASGSRCGDGFSALPTYICEMWRSRFVRPTRTQPHAISDEAGLDFDTSSADPSEAGRNPHSTSERKRTHHIQKNRLPASFPAICHLLVRESVMGETA